MSNELKPCPFCGGEARKKNPMSQYACCNNSLCDLYGIWILITAWNTRLVDVDAIMQKIKEVGLERGDVEYGYVEDILKEHFGISS